MSKARWAHAALIAAGLSACASTHGTPRNETRTSYLGGQAAQPSSWLSKGPSVDLNERSTTAAAGPAGQAAQPLSWSGEEPPSVAAPTRLAQDGSLYRGGRAGQPFSASLASPRQTSALASAPSAARH
jgi:hypothetical protein